MVLTPSGTRIVATGPVALCRGPVQAYESKSPSGSIDAEPSTVTCSARGLFTCSPGYVLGKCPAQEGHQGVTANDLAMLVLKNLRGRNAVNEDDTKRRVASGGLDDPADMLVRGRMGLEEGVGFSPR